MSNGWAVVGLGLGATTSAIGAAGLGAALYAPNVTPRDRYTISAVMCLLIGAGAVLSTMATARLQERRRA